VQGTTIIQPCLIRRVKQEFGILGNMSAHPVTSGGVEWRTNEALFQAMRFDANDPIIHEIRAEKNPMAAKLKAKGAADRMVIEQLGETDLDNMRLCLRLKLAAHEDVQAALRATEDRPIVEDCTKRQRGSGLFWGAALREDGWHGENWLGRLWMELR
jgi:ribA/ribD-fused uncharacterized protein